MQITITSRHFEITPAIREYVEGRFAALDHLGAESSHGNVVLDHDSHHGGKEYLLKAHFHGSGNGMNVELRSADLYAGIDGLSEMLKLQLRRTHDRSRLETSPAGASGQAW